MDHSFDTAEFGGVDEVPVKVSVSFKRGHVREDSPVATSIAVPSPMSYGRHISANRSEGLINHNLVPKVSDSNNQPQHTSRMGKRGNTSTTHKHPPAPSNPTPSHSQKVPPTKPNVPVVPS